MPICRFRITLSGGLMKLNGYYRDWSRLHRSERLTDVLVIASDFNSQLGCLWETESQTGGSLAVPPDRTDIGPLGALFHFNTVGL